MPLAVEIAAKAHRGVTGKDGQPYILHPLRLMMRATTDDERIVAVLHDTVEDTDLSLDDLTRAGFPEQVVAAVGALTRRGGETYEEFIDRVALDPLASRVKLLDLYDNIDLTRLSAVGDSELARAARYHRAIRQLKGT